MRKTFSWSASCVLLFAFFALLSACAPTATPSPTPQVIDVYASASTQSWLNDLYTCAAQQSVVVRLSDSESADIRLRLGEPENLTTPAYQIDSEEILVVTHRESPIQNMNADEVRDLFAGHGLSDVQIWVFDSGEDVQQVFEREVLGGTPITSQARLATDPQQMSDTLNNEKNAVGFLPKHWKMGNSRFVFTLPDVPVLAIVSAEPQGAIKEIIACLQK